MKRHTFAKGNLTHFKLPALLLRPDLDGVRGDPLVEPAPPQGLLVVVAALVQQQEGLHQQPNISQGKTKEK